MKYKESTDGFVGGDLHFHRDGMGVDVRDEQQEAQVLRNVDITNRVGVADRFELLFPTFVCALYEQLLKDYPDHVDTEKWREKVRKLHGMRSR